MRKGIIIDPISQELKKFTEDVNICRLLFQKFKTLLYVLIVEGTGLGYRLYNLNAIRTKLIKYHHRPTTQKQIVKKTLKIFFLIDETIIL